MPIRFSRLALALLLTAALASAATAAPKITVLVKGRSTFWKAVEKGALEAGARLGADVSVKSPLAETDVAVQIQLLNAAAAQGAEAIVIAPINKEALAVPVASLAIRGTKIVVIDTALTGKSAPVFVGTDQEAAGQAAGRLLAELAGESDEVALLRHNQTSGATLLRESGALAAFRAARPKNTLHAEIYGGADAGAEDVKCRLLLDTHPRIAAVLTTSTPCTMAMLKVLQERNLTGKVRLIGFGFNLNADVAAALDSGALHGWIAQLPTEFGARGVESAIALLKGEAIAPVIHTDFVVITKDNLHDAKTQALLAL